MSYRKFFSLSIVGLMFLVGVPLALAQGIKPGGEIQDSFSSASIGLLQTTPEVTGTVEATDEAATPEVTGTVEATDEVVTPAITGTVEATGEATTPAATTEPAGAAQATATPAVSTLPATGGVLTPWTSLALAVVGGLILLGGLGLALARRIR